MHATLRALAAVAALAILGCGARFPANEPLADRVNRFNNAVRWSNFGSAAQYVGDQERDAWLQSHSRWRTDVMVADYEVIETSLDDGGLAATVRVVVSWYTPNDMELQTTLLAQRWERRGRSWLLASESVEEGAAL